MDAFLKCKCRVYEFFPLFDAPMCMKVHDLVSLDGLDKSSDSTNLDGLDLVHQ